MDAKIRLHCPACKMDRWFQIGPWQTEPGIFGAFSLLCKVCSRMSLHVLTDGQEVTIS